MVSTALGLLGPAGGLMLGLVLGLMAGSQGSRGPMLQPARTGMLLEKACPPCLCHGAPRDGQRLLPCSADVHGRVGGGLEPTPNSSAPAAPAPAAPPAPPLPPPRPAPSGKPKRQEARPRPGGTCKSMSEPMVEPGSELDDRVLAGLRRRPVGPNDDLILIVAGAEGSGHHALLPVLNRVALDHDIITLSEKQAALDATAFDARPGSGTVVTHTNSFPFCRWRCQGFDAAPPAEGDAQPATSSPEEIEARLQSSPSRVYDFFRVCPTVSNWRRRPNRRLRSHYDLVGGVKRLLMANPKAQVRVVWLSRDFYSQAVSHGSVFLQVFGETVPDHARLTLWFTRFLNHELSRLSTDVIAVSGLAELVADCKQWVLAFLRFLWLDRGSPVPDDAALARYCSTVHPQPPRALPKDANADYLERLLKDARASGDLSIYENASLSLLHRFGGP